MDRVVLVLEKVRACFLAESVGLEVVGHDAGLS
jgi:hypothetical protein